MFITFESFSSLCCVSSLLISPHRSVCFLLIIVDDPFIFRNIGPRKAMNIQLILFVRPIIWDIYCYPRNRCCIPLSNRSYLYYLKQLIIVCFHLLYISFCNSSSWDWLVIHSDLAFDTLHLNSFIFLFLSEDCHLEITDGLKIRLSWSKPFLDNNWQIGGPEAGTAACSCVFSMRTECFDSIRVYFLSMFNWVELN